MSLSLLDIVFPKKCVSCSKVGSYICRKCFSQIVFVDNPVCPYCERQAVGGASHPGCFKKTGLDGLVVAARYRGPVKAAIVKIKYKWVYDIEKVLIDLLARNIWKFNLPQKSFLVPIPLHSRRKKWRGFNQAELLCRDLSKRFGVGYKNFLVRKIETKPQVGLSADDRKRNVRGAFKLGGGSIEGLDLVLVDDVYTTGATMQECAKVLKRAGAKSVWGMVIALG